MKKKCIVVDVENTLIDVVVRKHAILKDKFSNTSTIEDVRNDPKLYQILGRERSTIKDNFYNVFNNSTSVGQYPAPLFEDAKTVIENFIESGINVILISGRDTSFENAIKNELSNATNRLNLHNIQMHFKPILQDDATNYNTNLLNFKKNKIKKLSNEFDIIAYVGDNSNDVESAAEYNIPSIVFLTSNFQDVQVKNETGLHFCANWKSVEETIKMYCEGNEAMNEIRKEMLRNYAEWLGDIDHKLSICVTIATIICGITGTIITDDKRTIITTIITTTITTICMYTVFLLSLLSLIFSIRGFTARNTSGEQGHTKKAGKPVKIEFLQGWYILTGQHNKEALPNDAIEDVDKFNELSDSKKAKEHRTYLFKKFPTHDADSLWNYYFLSLRSSNYSKLYAERFASRLLIYAISLMGLWVTFVFVNFLIRYLCNYPPLSPV